MKKSIFVSQSSFQTQQFAKKFAKSILYLPRQNHAAVIGLAGELGSGKTTFVQGFARGLGIKEKVLSPTFLVYRTYKTHRTHLYHVDCYRLEHARELLELGWKEIVANPKHIVLVEWADRIRIILPRKTIRINFETSSKNQRTITFHEKTPRH